MTKLNIQNISGSIIEIFDGWKSKQVFNEKAGRWYVIFSKNSPLMTVYGRRRLLRSHYVYMQSLDLLEIPYDHVLHHKDHNRENDELENLQLMTIADHNKLHRDESLKHHRGAFRGKRHTPETIEKIKAIAQARGNNNIWDCPKSKHFEETREKMSAATRGERNASYRHDLIAEDVRAYFVLVKNLKKTAEHFNCSICAVRNRVADMGIELQVGGHNKKYSDEEIIVAFNECGQIKKTAMLIGASITGTRSRLLRLGLIGGNKNA